MKANELMIGDWVIPFDGIPRQIMALPRSTNGLYIEVHDGCCSLETTKPIPLTPKILEKNGFKKKIDDMGDYYYQLGDYESTIYYFFEYNTININHGYHKIFVQDKRYVHELQHALRLCGLTELADNFKV